MGGVHVQYMILRKKEKTSPWCTNIFNQFCSCQSPPKFAYILRQLLSPERCTCLFWAPRADTANIPPLRSVQHLHSLGCHLFSQTTSAPPWPLILSSCPFWFSCLYSAEPGAVQCATTSAAASWRVSQSDSGSCERTIPRSGIFM